MIPGLLAKLREGLDRIEYPPELTARFFNNLITIHRAAVHEGRDAISKAAADAVEAQVSQFSDSSAGGRRHLAGQPGGHGSGLCRGRAALARAAAAARCRCWPRQAERARCGRASGAPAPGWSSWSASEWVRAQLTWASPHATLFMFTSLSGSAHSMSRRTLDRLWSQGQIKVVADRNVVDDALDQVAKAALKNSVDGKS